MGTEPYLHKSHKELVDLLGEPVSPESLLPGLRAIAHNPAGARESPGARLVCQVLAPVLADIGNVPLTTYTLYREFRRTGERRGYQDPYAEKRIKMCAAAFQVLLGDTDYVDVLHDYIWNVCEETNWVIPSHENREVALRSVATGLALAELVTGLGDKLASEVSNRVRDEIERRIFVPYLERHDQLSWFKGHNNWNGVCNSGVGSTFLLLEGDIDRLARALELVLTGLDVFLATAFEADGGSTEGTSYWQYGLSNLIPFGEMLRIHTRGEIDILATDRLKAIAAYPTRMMLSPGRYANFSDCEEIVAFAPGTIARFAQRTGVTALLDVLTEGAPLIRETHVRRFHNLWRNIAWWDGTRPTEVTIGDTWARDVGVARLTATTASGVPVVLAAKAGHNAENHNQNDVGSFIVHVDGESLICEPGRGLYSRSYFSSKRYENVFANSFGHSVPRIGSQLQSAGETFRGQITGYEDRAPQKSVRMDIGGAYNVPGLQSIDRSLRLSAGSGDLVLEDNFTFVGDPRPVEEAFVTWFEVTVEGSRAWITGERHVLELEIKAPRDTAFALDVLSEASEANAKPVPLKRLTFDIAPSAQMVARVRGRVSSR